MYVNKIKGVLMMKIGIIGAGRIGNVHAKNIAMFVPELSIKSIADPFMNEESERYAKQYHIENIYKDADKILQDKEIQAVLICSSTDTHADFIIKAAQAGKDIFCEKPIAYDLKDVHAALDAVEKAKVKLQIGFCRRFDHNHRAVYEAVQQGKIGQPHLIRISSRDPEPPPISYVKVSGGIFYDMMIHDFDMARFLAGSEVTEVSAHGAVLIDKAIGEVGDVDTAAVVLKFASGAIAMIDNSRKAVYGYDQRVEVFGAKGCAQNENDIPNTMVLSLADGTTYGTAYKVMWDRYTEAFVNEMKAFAKALSNNEEVPATGKDGLEAIVIAAAAQKSLVENRPVKLTEVE